MYEAVMTAAFNVSVIQRVDTLTAVLSTTTKTEQQLQ